MTPDITAPKLEAPDAFYADLLAAHEELSKAESETYNARLILLMANHIADNEILRELLEAAKRK
ncbi:MAG: DUF2783 domain-containing protein [Pseudomonadota bacterium]